MIKNIVFDMGGVLIEFRPEYFIEKANLSAEDSRLVLQRVFHTAEWPMMDRGSLNEEEAFEILASRLPERFRDIVHSMIFDWNVPLKPVPGMAEYIRELKERGYGIYLLSNASRRQPEYWDNIPGSECFSGKLISYEIQRVKPEHEIYEELCRRFGLKAEECVFIDDSGINVEAAIFSGMKGIVFYGDTALLRQQLEEILNK